MWFAARCGVVRHASVIPGSHLSAISCAHCGPPFASAATHACDVVLPFVQPSTKPALHFMRISFAQSPPAAVAVGDSACGGGLVGFEGSGCFEQPTAANRMAISVFIGVYPNVVPPLDA